MSKIILFIFLSCISDITRAQVCTWSGSSSTYTRSVSAPAEFALTIENENFLDGGRLTWEGDDGSTPIDLSIMRYNAASKSFSELLSFSPRGTGRSQIGQHNLSIPSVTLNDNQLKISAVSGGCTTNDRSPTFTLDVKYCDVNFFAPDAIVTDLSNCGYNCERKFHCQVCGASFTATCEADATWSEKSSRYSITWRSIVPYVMVALAIIMTSSLWIYLLFPWYNRCGDSGEAPGIPVALWAALFPAIYIVLCIVGFILVLAPGYCNVVTVYSGIIIGSCLTVIALINILVLAFTDLHKFKMKSKPDRCALFKHFILLLCCCCGSEMAAETHETEGLRRGKGRPSTEDSGNI